MHLVKQGGCIMDIRKIKKLIDLIDETGVTEIEIKEGEESVRINRGTAGTLAHPTYLPNPITLPPYQGFGHPPPENPPVPKLNGHTTTSEAEILNEVSGHMVVSPMVGTMYISSNPGAEPFVQIGQKVAVGDTLCIIEAMKMYNEIEADKAGIIKSRLVENGQPVEYGQPLFIIE